MRWPAFAQAERQIAVFPRTDIPAHLPREGRAAVRAKRPGNNAQEVQPRSDHPADEDAAQVFEPLQPGGEIDKRVAGDDGAGNGPDRGIGKGLHDLPQGGLERWESPSTQTMISACVNGKAKFRADDLPPRRGLRRTMHPRMPGGKLAGDLRHAVARAVVHDDDFHPRIGAVQRGERMGHGIGFVQPGDDDADARGNAEGGSLLAAPQQSQPRTCAAKSLATSHRNPSE